jgi:hypothetical protein
MAFLYSIEFGVVVESGYAICNRCGGAIVAKMMIVLRGKDLDYVNHDNPKYHHVNNVRSSVPCHHVLLHHCDDVPVNPCGTK